MPSITSFAGAAAAYTRARADLPVVADVAGAIHGPRDAAPESGFAAMVRSALSDAVVAGRESERLSLAAVAEQADLSQVVTAVAEAETMLNTVVAVRDRVVEAYKDIMRMPI